MFRFILRPLWLLLEGNPTQREGVTPLAALYGLSFGFDGILASYDASKIKNPNTALVMSQSSDDTAATLGELQLAV